MTPDEKAVIEYLKGWPSSFVSGREIARKVGGKKRFERERGWAVPVLAQLVRMGVIEDDHFGYFRLRLDRKKRRPKTHIAPHLLRILQNSGKKFEGLVIDEDIDESLPYLPTPPVQNNS